MHPFNAQVNLDPAAESFEYDVAFDVRDLITLSDVMEELELGPNGGLVRHQMQYHVCAIAVACTMSACR
jgi:Conserved hypothetical ATP binding protein